MSIFQRSPLGQRGGMSQNQLTQNNQIKNAPHGAHQHNPQIQHPHNQNFRNQNSQGQAPYHDPSVRFEPYNPQNTPHSTHQQNQHTQPHPAPQAPPLGLPAHNMKATQDARAGQSTKAVSLYDDFKKLAQAEANSIAFYDHLANHKDARDEHKQYIATIIENKKTAQSHLTRAMGRDLATTQGMAHPPESLHQGLAYAVLQESELLRHIAKVYENVEEAKLAKLMSILMYNKTADIATLAALRL
ncbi:MAG: hypothetical protein FWC69_00070 [Defluviitaleaceae bacterium]|nr:hypothetical protein [Defluviitaleaceae bacterium]